MGGAAPDVYGRGQRPWLLPMVVVVALVVGLAAGAALDREVLPRPAPTPAPGQGVTAGVPGAGPTGVAAGVPVGYEHSERGAAQAAGNYTAVLGQVDETKAKAALDQVAEPTSRARLEQGLDSSAQGEEGLWGVQSAQRQGKRVVLTQTPISYKIDSYTPQEATVRVWLVTTVGVENRQRLVAFFGITGMTLTWLNGDWRLRSIDGGNQAGDVVPASLQTPTQTGGVPDRLVGFVPYGTA